MKNFEIVTTNLVVSCPARFDNEEEVRYVGTSVQATYLRGKM
jgi:hypothetical protein